MKPWNKVGAERREAVIEHLEGLAHRAGSLGDKQAYVAAIERLRVRPKTTQRREVDSYGRSRLCKLLDVPATRPGAIAEILVAIRDAGGVENAYPALGVARRTLYYTIARNEDVRIKVEALVEELKTAPQTSSADALH